MFVMSICTNCEIDTYNVRRMMSIKCFIFHLLCTSFDIKDNVTWYFVILCFGENQEEGVVRCGLGFLSVEEEAPHRAALGVYLIHVISGQMIKCNGMKHKDE